MKIIEFVSLALLGINSFACKSSPKEKIDSLEEIANTDTVILKNKSIVFLSPTLKEIYSLKKKFGEDFSTMADDANFYRSNAINFLDSVNVSYINTENNKVFSFYSNSNNLVPISIKKKDVNYWPLILFDNENKTFEISNLSEFKKNYNDFFSTDKYRKTVRIQEIKSKMSGKYNIVKEEYCDLNKDGKNDEILIFNPKNEDANTDSIIMDSPIFILINQGGGFYKSVTNSSIIYTSIGNCPSNGFENLVIKDNYFTIEQSICGGWDFISEYVTFKWDKEADIIILHKYSQSFTDRRDPNKEMPSKIYSNKDFGKVYFESFTQDLIASKIRK